jgi:hypothetical protein
MRRALASLLLALFSFPLALPMLRADAASSLPSCCRREGKHKCSMNTGSAETTSGPALRAMQPKCSSYPSASTVPGSSNFALIKNSPSIGASLLRYPSVEAQTEAQYRISFSRSRQKRGPPTLLP